MLVNDQSMSKSPKTTKEVFLAALDVPQPARTAFLEEACGGNAALRRQVEALLQVHDEPDSLLDRPRIDVGLAARSCRTPCRLAARLPFQSLLPRRSGRHP